MMKTKARRGAARLEFAENQKRKHGDSHSAERQRFPDTFQDRPVKKVKSAKDTIPHHPSNTQAISQASSGSQDALSENEPSASFTYTPVDISSTHQLKTMNIISSSQIQKKVTSLLDTLATFSFSDPKPHVVLLQAKASVSSKLITIVEIAKRELAKSGAKWFQYNVVGNIMVEHAREPSTVNTTTALGVEDTMDLEEEDDEPMAFEKMKTPFERAIEGRPKVRGTATLALYLSRVRVETLRKAYGEQTNALT